MGRTIASHESPRGYPHYEGFKAAFAHTNPRVRMLLISAAFLRFSANTADIPAGALWPCEENAYIHAFLAALIS
jgi:hypothetical protein